MLLTPLQKTNATIAALGQTIASHLAAAANAANQQAATALAMSDDDLTEWIQTMDTASLFAAHEALGSAINTAASAAHDTLAESGIDAPLGAVDTRSVPEKLAAQRREIQIIDGLPVVITLPPPPEPEPEPEPEP
jgi:hypothetical protein